MTIQEKINLDDPSLYQEFKSLSEKTSKKPLVLFFGRSTFSDNTKYLFLACQRANPSFEIKWCTAEKRLHEKLLQHGLPSFLVNQDWRETVNLFLEAACTVYCENPYSALWSLPLLRGCLSGATQIQLWHGISVKHLDLMLIPHENFNILSHVFRNNLIAATQIDFLASSSSHFDEFWVKSFGASKILRTGQARNEVLFRDAHHLELIDSVFTEKEEEIFSKDSTKVLIAPTWQRTRETWINSEDFLNKLNDIGAKENIDFFIKQHPFTLRIDGNKQSKTKRKYIHSLDPGFDIYPWLRFFSAMIGDYSSIMFDYLATEMPVLTLELEDKSSFEPDWSLLPSCEGLYAFTPQNFKEVFDMALKKHPKRAEQKEMIRLFYETDLRDTNKSLIHFLEQESFRKTTKDYEVQKLGVTS